MSSYIINSRSDNTAKSYYYSFNRWSTFAKKHSFDVLPAESVHIALFITHLLDSGATHNTINSIIYSIKWVHGMCNKNDPNNTLISGTSATPAFCTSSLIWSLKRIPTKQKFNNNKQRIHGSKRKARKLKF
jgi:hypothetical protein